MNLEEVISVLPVFLSAAIKQRAMGEYNAVPRSNVGEGKQLSVSERHKEDLGSNVVVCKHRNYLRSPTKGKFLRKPEAFQDCKSLIWPFVTRSSHMNMSIIDMA